LPKPIVAHRAEGSGLLGCACALPSLRTVEAPSERFAVVAVPRIADEGGGCRQSGQEALSERARRMDRDTAKHPPAARTEVRADFRHQRVAAEGARCGDALLLR
jgi:hypothetical protein